MMFEGKHIHFSPVDKKPLCSYSTKLCKQRRINGYAFCIRHILEDKSAPFKQCAHVARYNKQKCTNPIPSNENREFCNSHMQVAGILPKKERKSKKEKDKELFVSCDGKLKFADRLRALLKKENSISCNDDPFNSDDPYAFPDTISEQENGCIGFSATPILRTAWNCSQKICNDSASDLPLRYDLPSKNSISFDGKIKSSTPKLSKTVNRLHAKIAQNKILDKQKKTQDSSQSTVALANSNFHTVSNIKTEPLSPVDRMNVCNKSNQLQLDEVKTEAGVKIEPPSEDDTQSVEILSASSDNVPNSCHTGLDQLSNINSCSSPPSPHQEQSSLLSNDSSDERTQICSIKTEAKCMMKSATNVPLALKKLHMVLNNRKKRNDLIPLGFETSDSEATESEDESYLLSQISSFCARNRSSLSQLQSKSSRHHKIRRLKSELKQSYQQLCRLHTLHTQEEKHQRYLIQPLIHAARVCPNEATEVLMDHVSPYPLRKSDKSTCGRKRCNYKQDDVSCDQIALPYTWHCQKHIMCNADQLLFQHCTAKYPDNTQCSVPVFDVCHELPLCDEHAKKRDNYQKMTLEPKPKKPRKKPKLSALTRAPKRGKKKKKPNPLRPVSPAHPLLPPPSSTSNSTASHVSSQLSFADATLKPVQAVLQTAEITRDLNGEIDSELGSDIEEQFSPGAIDKSLELPLDAAELANQATKLLDEHDFTEVLNKLPDDAFNDLFVEARNGDYIPIPNEELERALAAVSKDVHLSNVSLAKLSSNTGPDLEELERSIDIHSSLLGAENLSSAIDENALRELNNSLNVITSSFSSSDLNSFTQALSSIAAESIEHNHLPAVSDSHLIQNSVATVPLLTSDMTHPHVLNGHTSVAGLPPLTVDPNFATHLLDNGMNPAMHESPADGRLLSGSHLATILFGLGQATGTSHPQTTFANSSNISEDAGLISTQGGLTSTHWLLNSSDQVLALSHMAYQNGFVSSQSGTPYTTSPLLTSVGKYPLQAISAEVSLVSSNSSLVTSSSSEGVTCGSAEPTVPNMNHTNRPVSLQQNGSATVIVQEGAS